nr:hypothetical protein [Staphylococcus haemolyticus]
MFAESKNPFATRLPDSSLSSIAEEFAKAYSGGKVIVVVSP